MITACLYLPHMKPQARDDVLDTLLLYSDRQHAKSPDLSASHLCEV